MGGGDLDRVVGYREVQVISFMLRYYAEHCRSPTYHEVMAATGITSEGEVSRIVSRIVSRGIASRGKPGRRPKAKGEDETC